MHLLNYSVYHTVEAVKAAEDLAKAATLVPAPVAVISVPVPLPVATVPPPAVVVVTSSSTSSSSSAPTSSSSSVSETVHSVEVVKSPLSLPVSPVAKGAVHVQSQVHGQQGNVQVPEAVVGDGGGGVGSMGKPPVPLAINTNTTTPTITSSGSRWSTVAVLPSRTSPVSIVDDKDEIRSSSSSIISPTNAMLKVVRHFRLLVPFFIFKLFKYLKDFLIFVCWFLFTSLIALLLHSQYHSEY